MGQGCGGLAGVAPLPSRSHSVPLNSAKNKRESVSSVAPSDRRGSRPNCSGMLFTLRSRGEPLSGAILGLLVPPHDGFRFEISLQSPLMEPSVCRVKPGEWLRNCCPFPVCFPSMDRRACGCSNPMLDEGQTPDPPHPSGFQQK